MRLFLAVLASIALMVWDHHKKQLYTLREGLMTLLVPIERIVSIPADFVMAGTIRLAARSDLIQENQLLKEAVRELRVQNQRLVALESENSRLRKLLGSVEKAKGRRLVAEILTVDNDPFRHIVTINKGSYQNVFVGQAVLDAFGIMGQVIQVSPFSSRVLLISDPLHSVPVKVARSGVRSLAVGTGDGQRLSLQHVPDTLDIKRGDVLISSGLGQRFPEGFPVAEVVSVHHDPGEPFARIDVIAKAQLSRSGQVVLVWPEQIDRAEHTGQRKGAS